jgi:hypothetical protein
MTDPSPYEQGFRDALLSVRAQLFGEGWPVKVTCGWLDDLIDQKNHDLWNLLAIAQVDLSHHPEAEGLRAMLRAPSGLLINSEGQVLFVRIKGTEYDTGVLALREEVERLKAAVIEDAIAEANRADSSGNG